MLCSVGVCHCKRFMDGEYKNLINDSEINIYRVDFTKEGDDLNNIQKNFLELDNILGQILAFPTLLKIDSNTKKVSQFKGDRDNVDILKKFFNE